MNPARPQRVTILGLGLFGGGVGATRYYAGRGARVVVTDLRNEAVLEESLRSLSDVPVELHLGGHSEADFKDADVVIVNPAVPPNAPVMDMARQCGARLDTAINLLFRECPAPMVAVTGTNGKSTTAALLGDIFRAAGRRAWVGGNLGGSLLSDLDRIRPDDIVVLELSSFQCERLAWVKKSPHIAVVTNLTPNHLDRHHDMADYASAKQELLRYQTPDDYMVLNADDPTVRAWGGVGRGQSAFVGQCVDSPVCADWKSGMVRLTRNGVSCEVSIERLALPGRHNQFNAACAAMAAWLAGVNPAAIEAGLSRAKGLPDRLECVGEHGGIRFYNDSISTTPESTLAALDAFEVPVHLIAGGSSKNLCFSELGHRIASTAASVTLLGATADDLETAIRATDTPPPPLSRVSDLKSAVRTAYDHARSGDVVLLSPACASYDMFSNYRERGTAFRRTVRDLARDVPPHAP